MNKIIQKFELDPKTLKVKELLNKDFLELEIKAISTANPNRNGSSFTKESLEKAIPTLYNKPILGSFSIAQNDFRAHEGELAYDEEYEQLYYDYTDEISEIPLGMIRSDDKIKVYHDNKDGLDWLIFTCAIWVKYNYKQVKSLLKSKDATKRISVEVEVLDSEFDENNVEIIKDFSFCGVTILGDKYETGIADAKMTILDMVDNAIFQKQQKCLAFAYDLLKQQGVETPDEAKVSIKDSNIKNTNFIENEETPQISMEEGENQKRGGISAMQLTMRAKIELLQAALEKALNNTGEKEEPSCIYVWVMDICEKYVYFEIGDQKFRCPYAITELGEEHEVALDLDAKERVVSSWSVFDADKVDNAGNQETFDHEEGKEKKCIECTIRDLIIDEEEAIQGYSHAEHHFEEEYPLIAKIFHELKEEEEVHVGELTQALQMINDETMKHQDEGIQEAKDIVVEEILEGQEEGKPKEEQPESEGKGGLEKIFEKDKDDKDDKDDDDDDKDDNKDDDDDKDDDKDDDDKDDQDENYGCNKNTESCDKNTESCDKNTESCDGNTGADKEKECKFSNSIDPNAEPLNIDVSGQTMTEIIENSTESIKAPNVQTQSEELGDANQEVSQILTDVDQRIIQDTPDGAINPNETGENPEVQIQQPNDDKKARDEQFEKQVDFNGEKINIDDLLVKYNELTQKYNEINESIKAQQALALINFATEFINSDEIVDNDAKKNYIAQVTEKCNSYEFTSEEEVKNFAKSLMAMYYYEHQSNHKVNSTTEFSLVINRDVDNNNTSKNKLKDAINKLNYLNEEE